VHLCMAWLRRHAPDRALPGRLDRLTCLAEPEFRARLAGWV